MELSTQISDKIDCLDVVDMVDAVNNAYNERETGSAITENAAEKDSEEKVDTNINFLNSYQGVNYDNHN